MPDATVKNVVAELAPAPDDADSPHGTFEVILSTPTVDRDGETLNPDEWEQPLPEHITFDIDHGMSVASTVGSGRPELDEHGNLRVRGTYASTELAQNTRALVTEGHIRTTSVAFLRKQDRKTGNPRRELLNGAFVAVPANPAALVLDSKATAPGRAARSDARKIQAIHDHAYALGANCAAGKDTEPTASDTASLRGQLAGIDTTALPEPVRVLLTALGLIDADHCDPAPPSLAPAPADDGAGRAALAVRATQLRAIHALATTER